MRTIKRLLLFLCLSPLFVLADNVTITGRVNRPETLVRLMICDDLLNMSETLVAETYSDDKGFFILEGSVSQTLPGAIYVGLESVDLVVSPGAAYEVAITIPEQDPTASYFDRLSPTLRVKTASDKGLYRQLVLSEDIISGYVLNYFDEIYRRRQVRYLDSIRMAIQAEVGTVCEYVAHENDYRIAAVQMALNADGGQKVIRDYYDGKPVLYHCQAYMDLFKDLFKNYESNDAFKERNPRLAEMIAIYQLRTAYYNETPRYRGAIRQRIQAIKDKTNYAETKKMVGNMLKRFDKFAPGAPATDFELKDMAGNTVKLSDYKNTVVVLQFLEGTSRTVEHQLEELADFVKQWQGHVQLITITTKDQAANWQRRFEAHHYDWPLLNLGNDILLLEHYEVLTFPEYFIINKGTKIGMAPAPSPDQTLGDYVQGMLEK